MTVKRGRKPLPDDQKTQTKNVTIDAELVEALNTAADTLEEKFGFRPTLSQTLRHLIKQVPQYEYRRRGNRSAERDAVARAIEEGA